MKCFIVMCDREAQESGMCERCDRNESPYIKLLQDENKTEHCPKCNYKTLNIVNSHDEIEFGCEIESWYCDTCKWWGERWSIPPIHWMDNACDYGWNIPQDVVVIQTNQLRLM